MMTTFVQLLIAAILNILGMAPEEHELATPVKTEILIESNFEPVSFAEKGKNCCYDIFKDVREIN